MFVRICDKGKKYLYLPSSIRDAIKMKNDGFTFRKRARSFKFAFNGIKLLITKEHNIVSRQFAYLSPEWYLDFPAWNGSQ